jgi:uncharacterized protein YjbI with pentapeptide repeats
MGKVGRPPKEKQEVAFEQAVEIFAGHKKWYDGISSGVQAIIRDVKFCGLDLKAINAIMAEFIRCEFIGCDLSGANFSGALIDRTRIVGCTLRGCRLDGMTVSNSDLSRSYFGESNLFATHFENVKFTSSNLELTKLIETKFIGCQGLDTIILDAAVGTEFMQRRCPVAR